MDGWDDSEFRNKNLMAPCGLYCGTCGVYLATRDDNEKFRTVMGNLYGTSPGETRCLGCMQPDPPGMLYGYCKLCTIRDCVRSKGFYSCHQCGDWPCETIRNFGLATGRRVMRRAIPLWRRLVERLGHEEGSVEWARSECERYHCPSCGKPLFRGAVRCRACKAEVAPVLDGRLDED
jgi:hypothetical protein